VVVPASSLLYSLNFMLNVFHIHKRLVCATAHILAGLGRSAWSFNFSNAIGQESFLNTSSPRYKVINLAA
jgi:hypothetical protein